jgi:hypothetical protein
MKTAFHFKQFLSLLNDQKLNQNIIVFISLSILFLENSGKVIFAGLGALQGESLQDEPRLRGTNIVIQYPTA